MKDPIFQPKIETRVDDELAFHVEMATRDLIASGVHPTEARRQAEATLGDRQRLADECKRLAHDIERSERRTQYFSALMQDTRFALRLLSRRRSFAAIAIATLTIGIGAATAIYSIVDGVLLRPLPFSEPERVGALWIRQPELARNPTIAWLAEATPVGNEEYQAIRAGARTLTDVALYATSSQFVSRPEGTERISAAIVTSSLFTVLRLSMALGHPFVAGDDALNAAPVALVDWNTWQSKYNADSGVLGKSVVLNREAHTIVGVLPKGLRLDRTTEPPPYWVAALRDSSDMPERHNRNYYALARLAPGATYARASAELSRIIREVTRNSTSGARVEQWQRDESRQSRPALLGLLGAAIFLLGIACVNVAMLLLGESANRAREMAARAALGAGSGRLARQLLVESLVIALLSAVLASGVAWAFMRGLVALAPIHIPGLDEVVINTRVLAFAALVATATGLLFGVAPALTAGRSAVASLTRLGTGQSGRRGALLQRGLIATQLALSVILLTNAFLLTRSFRQLTSINPGFRSSGITVARVSMPWELFREPDQNRAVARLMQERVAALPGVERVAIGSAAPFAGGGQSSPITIQNPDGSAPETVGQHTQQRYVGPGFFEIMGMRLLRGRLFDQTDNSSSNLVAVISAAEVRRDFNGRNPLGVRVQHQGKWRQIVGVVSDVKYRGLPTENEATIYVPFDQNPSVSFTVLAQERQTTTLAIFRRALREVEPNAVITGVDPLKNLVAASYTSERYRTALIIAFASVAALLAAVGMYGVGSRSAARRTKEVGIHRQFVVRCDGALAGYSDDAGELRTVPACQQGRSRGGVARGVIFPVQATHRADSCSPRHGAKGKRCSWPTCPTGPSHACGSRP